MAKAQNVLERIRQLDEEKQKLLDEAKQQALANAQAAVDELNELGFNYRLVEGTATRVSRGTSTGTRRTGIRDDVFNAVKQAGPDGTTPAAIRQALGVEGKSGTQSVANALSALKRAGKITDKDGSYIAA